jgi:two-component system sensor histidine kinase CpxA
MKPRLPLFTKVLFLSFLNLCLLGLVVDLIVRAQFRLHPGSFLLAPAQGRMIAAGHALALELEEIHPERWNETLARYGQTYRVTFVLFDETGERVAGPELPVPAEVAVKIPRRQRVREGPPPANTPEPKGPPQEPGRAARAPAPPLFLTATTHPTGYWAGVRVPVRQDRPENPHPGTLLMMSPSLLASQLFFDITPWLTIGLAVILVSVVCWLPFIRGLTRSISQMTRAAGQIAEGRFEVQVSARRRDELGQLGATVNRMASRLSWGFDVYRPEMAMPVHQLLAANGVTAFFHGHDHLYAHQQLDGITYQETPQPSANNANLGTRAADYGYTQGTLLGGRGYLRVQVSPNGVTVNYIETWLPSERKVNQVNAMVADSYTILPVASGAAAQNGKR